MAAGIAGLIKISMAIKNKKLPASLFYKEANPELKLESSPFYVNDKLSDWKIDGKPLLAGLSSFGIELQTYRPVFLVLVVWDKKDDDGRLFFIASSIYFISYFNPKNQS